MMGEAIIRFNNQSRNTTKLNQYQMSLDEEVIPLSNEEIPVYPVWRNGNFCKILFKPEWIMLWEGLFGVIYVSKYTTKLNAYHMRLEETDMLLSTEDILVYRILKNGNSCKN